MQSPIYGAETLFPVQAADGRVLRGGSEEPRLFDGVRVQKLRQMHDLVQIETRSGAKLHLSSESIFSLVRRDGMVVLFNPPNAAMRNLRPIDWRAPVEDAMQDYRRWWVIGAVLSGGHYSADANRPTRLVLDAGLLAADVGAFLSRVAEIPAFFDKHRNNHKVNFHLVADRFVITSRVLDKLVRQAVEPKTHRLEFDPTLLPLAHFHGLVSGLLAGMKIVPGEAGLFQHRDSAVVEGIHRALHDRAGIASVRVINQMEPEMQASRRVTEPHRLILYPSALDTCRWLGVFPGDLTGVVPTGARADEIVRVEPIGAQRACILLSDTDDPELTTANWFLVKPRFEIDPVITDLATMDTLFMDPKRLPRRKEIVE